MTRGLAGFRAWLWQRASAVYLLFFIVYVLSKWAFWPPESAAALRAWLYGSPMWFASLLFILALSVHAWVGVRDIVLDYLACASARLLALALIVVSLLICGFWAVRIFLVWA